MNGNDLTVELPGSEPALLRQFCAEYVAQARESIRERVAQGELSKPGTLLADLSDSFDRLLRALVQLALGPDPRIAVIALGGYGRKQLYPYSDIDLLLVPDGLDAAHVEKALEGVIYPLWDARVSVGHAVRTIDQTLKLAKTDLTMRTSLLDARHVAGSEQRFIDLQEGTTRRFFGARRVHQFIQDLLQERRQRHPRFGDTVYLLEPNVKSCSGGIRDINTSLWAAKACFGISDLYQLADAGAATARQQDALLEAQDLQSRLRIAMHVAAGRAQDRLLFETQECLAPTLFPEQQIPGQSGESAREPVPLRGVAPAVERLMHAYYRGARTVVLETEGILQRCAVATGSAEERRRKPIDEYLYAVAHLLQTDVLERFWEQPAELVRVFGVATRRGLGMHRMFKDAIAEAAAGHPGFQLRADEVATEEFWSILVDEERVYERFSLERMHDLGVLTALLPEFEPCTGLIQHDLYHVFTVDRHSLYVVSLLKALRRGELADGFPMPTEVIKEVTDFKTLFLGALLHDIAKPLGRGHARRGARLAAGVAARLGLTSEEMKTVVFLVEHHLAMPHVSQRRDLTDATIIESFAKRVQNVDRLRALYLLSVADTAMTAPGNLTDWKASLLNELFAKTYRHITTGSAQMSKRDLTRRRGALNRALVQRWGESVESMVERLPDDLIARHDVKTLTHHVSVALQRQRDPGAKAKIGTQLQRDGKTTVLTICCDDAPGLLATITGALVLHRVGVMFAQIYTIPDDVSAKPDGGWALDIFWVEASDPTDLRSWEAFSATLERALGDAQQLSTLVARRLKPSALPPRVVPHVHTEIVVDNEGSDKCTIVEIYAPDVLGLLHAVTHKLSKLGLVIDVAKVTTEAAQVADIFYVRDRGSGVKITDPRQVERIRGELRDIVETMRAPSGRRAPLTGPFRADMNS